MNTLREVKLRDSRLNTWSQPEATLEEALGKAEDLTKQQVVIRTLAIIHAGLENVVNRQETAKKIEKAKAVLRSLLKKSRRHWYAICSVPIIHTRV